jgi:hypothetical protein
MKIKAGWVIGLALLLILIGLHGNEDISVLQKAATICMECIGLG